MTVATATNFTISHTIDQDIVESIEATFDGFRSRIALLSVEACGTLTAVFSTMGPVEPAVIDIDAIESTNFQPEIVAQDAVVLELLAA